MLEGRRAIIIAHRLSTVRDADHIIVLRDGRIAEQGHHAELLTLGGLYHDLYWRGFQEVGADAQETVV